MDKQAKPQKATVKPRTRGSSSPARSDRATKLAANGSHSGAKNKRVTSKSKNAAARAADLGKEQRDEWLRKKEELTLRAFRIAFENHQRYKS